MAQSKEYCWLENQGNTCYLNAVLQTLFMTKGFRQHVQRLGGRVGSSDGSLAEELKKLFSELETQQKTAVSADEVTKSLGITDVGKQRDAAEHLHMIIEKTPGSSELFKGAMKTTKKWSCRHNPGETFEDFLSLQVSLQNSPEVENAIKEYVNQMCGEYPLYCSDCKNTTVLVKKSVMIRFPEILIIQLSRFESVSYGRSYTKSALEVIIRPQIKVSFHTYELYAIINHSTTDQGGHYNADIKCEDDGIWRRFDDDIVSESSSKGVFRNESSTHRSSEAYLLVYRCREQFPCGLISEGMTSYLNAVLQTLFMTDSFRDHVMSLRNEVTSKSSGENLSQALADLFWSLMQERTAVSTEEVTRALNITNVFEQQDAAEYLQMILHRVPEPSEIFRGIMVTSTVCSYCKHNNEEETEFLSIPLSIDDRGQHDVEYALVEYMGIHDMSGDDRLFCVTCDSMRDMKMGNVIKKWPDILTLQLKRFEMRFRGNELHYWKNECKVKIPPMLQVDSVKYESSTLYDLYAVINHQGSYISGHFDAVIKDKRGNWYHFKDHTVTTFAKELQMVDACSKSAYLLMYRKVTEEAAASGRDEGHKRPISESRSGLSSSRP